MSVNSLSARLHLVMPASNVEELTSKFGYKFAMGSRKQDLEKEPGAPGFDHTASAGFGGKVKAVLHEFELDAQDILQLQTGDVIPLTKRIHSDIDVYVEDQGMLSGEDWAYKAQESDSNQ